MQDSGQKAQWRKTETSKLGEVVTVNTFFNLSSMTPIMGFGTHQVKSHTAGDKIHEKEGSELQRITHGTQLQCGQDICMKHIDAKCNLWQKKNCAKHL